jgi:hypothetical protein
MKRKADSVPETQRPSIQVEKPKVRPPPIYTERETTEEMDHILTLMQAWSWLRTFHHSLHVEYIRIFPDKFQSFQKLGVLSLLLKENPHGIYIVSNMDYLQYYVTMTETPMRTPNPIEYYNSVNYFREHNATLENLDNFSSDEDY